MPAETPDKVVFVLPSLDPDERILSLTAGLSSAAGHPVDLLVVDDGSCPAKQPIFAQLEKMPGCTVLHHGVNRGKGAALKTAFRYLLEHNKGMLCGCVTADGDGQHLEADILRAAELLKKNPGSLVLGCRVFNGEHVPWKSRFGNNMTRFMFASVLRRKISDTQTGLRGIPARFMKDCLNLPGDRFEFETEMLLATRKSGVSVLEYPIETVYFDANSGTHFHPVKDACRIYGVIFRYLLGEFAAFVLSSLSAAAVDLGLFSLLYYAILPDGMRFTLFGKTMDPHLFLSCFTARVCSSLWNFYVNRHLVFRTEKSSRKPMWRCLSEYYLLCVVIFVASWLLTSLVSHFIPQSCLTLGKLAVDLVLFLVCYFTQKFLIFRRKKSC